MPWTYQQRMDRACRLLSDRDLIDSDAIEVINRPLFFAKYKFSLGISPTHLWWHRFDELKQQLTDAFVGMDVQVVANPTTYDFYVYGNDVAAIRWVARHDAPFFFNFLRLIPESAWTRPPPSPRFKGKFYGAYQYRVRMKNSLWGNLPDSQQALNAISGDHRVVVRRHVGQQAQGVLAKDSFIYANKLNDVLMLKLILGDQIADIEER